MTETQDWLTEVQFNATVQRLDHLVQEFEVLPYPQVREKVFELLQTVDTVHREALTRLVAFVQAQGQADVLDQAATDPIIHTLFSLYDLIPTDDREQVESALEAVRPYIHSHGGAVEVLDVVEGIVHLRLSGACQGCVGSAITLQRGIEAALRDGYPGFRGIQVHDLAPPTHAIPGGIPDMRGSVIGLEQLEVAPSRSLRRPVFQAVAALDELPSGTLKHVDVDGVPVLLANVGGEVYAVRDQCPQSIVRLSLGSFSPPIIICPWHNEAFDVRTGKRTDGENGPGLDVFPIALADGMVKLAVNTIASRVKRR